MREHWSLEQIIEEYPDFGKFVKGFDKSWSFNGCEKDIERIKQCSEQLGFFTEQLVEDTIGIYR